MNVTPSKARRTQRRLAYVQVRRPGALKHVDVTNGVNRKEFRKVKRYSARVRRAESAKAQKRSATKPGGYNPLAPLTGKQYRKEERASERAQFRPRAQELKTAIGAQEQTTANVGTYYDDYKRALDAASQRVQAADAANVAATEGRVDTAYQQDKSAVEGRDTAMTAQERALGFNGGKSAEGARAVEAARSQGNQAAARTRDRAGADTKYLELRSANALLGKTEAVGRENTKRENLRKEQKSLAADRGDFRTKFRTDTRESERTYALARKEFGLKKQDLNLKYKTSAADRGLERQKINTQKIVARMYSNADKASARAQIRVAKLQLKKGKISQHQYRQILNIYKGLPKKGKSGGAGGAAAPKPLSVTEEKTVKKAFGRLQSAGVRVDQRKAAINQLIGKYGYPPRVAREAWRRYALKAPGSNYGGPH